MPGQFDRHRLVWGDARLKALHSAHVVIAGMGGLGCVVAEQLARAGLGRLTLIDCGAVGMPDLGRQILYSHDDLGARKVAAAARRLTRLSPLCEVSTLNQSICPGQPLFPANHADYLPPPVAYADCLDNFPSRFALEEQLPHAAFLVHAGIEAERGQLTTVIGGGPFRLRDIFSGARPPASPLPVIPQCCTVVGAMQSLAVINNIWWNAGLLAQSEFHATYQGRLAFIDLADGRIDVASLAG